MDAMCRQVAAVLVADLRATERLDDQNAERSTNSKQPYVYQGAFSEETPASTLEGTCSMSCPINAALALCALARQSTGT